MKITQPNQLLEEIYLCISLALWQNTIVYTASPPWFDEAQPVYGSIHSDVEME